MKVKKAPSEWSLGVLLGGSHVGFGAEGQAAGHAHVHVLHPEELRRVLGVAGPRAHLRDSAAKQPTHSHARQKQGPLNTLQPSRDPSNLLVGGAILPVLAVPASTRISARLKRVLGTRSPVEGRGEAAAHGVLPNIDLGAHAAGVHGGLEDAAAPRILPCGGRDHNHSYNVSIM